MSFAVPVSQFAASDPDGTEDIARALRRSEGINLDRWSCHRDSLANARCRRDPASYFRIPLRLYSGSTSSSVNQIETS